MTCVVVASSTSTRLMFRSWMNWMLLPMSPGAPRVQRGMYQHGAMFCSNQYPGPLATLTSNTPAMWPPPGDAPSAAPDAGFIGIPRKIMALKNLKAIIIDLNYIKGILFFLDLTGE